jgi:hypothetical protein
MCRDEEDAPRPNTDPASAPRVTAFNALLRKLKPAIALAAGRKAAAAYHRKHYLQNRNSYLARKVYRRAIERGELTPPPQCEQCGGNAGGIEGHHCDYNKPLDVMWLCRLCHRKWHAKHGKALNG